MVSCGVPECTNWEDNPNIAILEQNIIQTFPDIFKGMQHYLPMFSPTLSHVQAHWETLRHVEAYSGIIVAYWAVFRYIQNCVALHIRACHIKNPSIFIEPMASSKGYQTCKMIRHIQSPGIVRTAYSSIFRDI